MDSVSILRMVGVLFTIIIIQNVSSNDSESLRTPVYSLLTHLLISKVVSGRIRNRVETFICLRSGSVSVDIRVVKVSIPSS